MPVLHPGYHFRRICALGSFVPLLLSLVGCVHSVDPQQASLDVETLDGDALSRLVLTRRVMKMDATQLISNYGIERRGEAASRSYFGAVGDIADPRCIVEGILQTFAGANIVPSDAFWTLMGPGRETITLAEVLRDETVMRLEGSGIRVLVAAYQQRVDLESHFMEALIEGGVTDVDRETASIAVFDLAMRKAMHVGRVQYDDYTIVAHAMLVVPLAGFTVATSDPCEGVGALAGKMLAGHFEDQEVGLVVVAAKDDPYMLAR